MNQPHPTNRRQHERFVTPPMYTPISVRLLDEERYGRTGHAIDVSEGGIRFELDDPIDPGTPIAIRIDLPLPLLAQDAGPGRAVFALGNVIWADDDDVAGGPVTHAVAFTRFARAGDRERLVRALTRSRAQRAA
ncbi:MAG: PilZ domain-containing protein [Phycisphaerales bacterium]|jgi:hypothetical protein|nr:PilZ domain-containing protein [Phycisphaerales bacterium]